VNKSKTQDSPVALITGAARRIGAAIAVALHTKGFNVMIHYHTSSRDAHALVTRLGERAHTCQADLTSEEARRLLIEKTVDWGGRLDVLVNNASLFSTTESAANLFTVNAEAPYHLSQCAYPHLAKTKGNIVNITDTHATKPLKGYSLYCQSKAALHLQTKSLALEFAPNVRVNAVAPGAILWPEGDNALNLTRKQRIIDETPLKRHGDPQFIAQAVIAFINNPFITGEVLAVDGGRTLG